MEKSTLVIGAHISQDRYANKAVRSLVQHKQSVIAYGNSTGFIDDIKIENSWDPNWNIDTITLYINPLIQESYYQKIINLHPRRVIFNPGTENEEFMKLLSLNGIISEVACTLVLLSIGQYDDTKNT